MILRYLYFFFNLRVGVRSVPTFPVCFRVLSKFSLRHPAEVFIPSCGGMRDRTFQASKGSKQAAETSACSPLFEVGPRPRQEQVCY
jgi:hypothetical protein